MEKILWNGLSRIPKSEEKAQKSHLPQNQGRLARWKEAEKKANVVVPTKEKRERKESCFVSPKSPLPFQYQERKNDLTDEQPKESPFSLFKKIQEKELKTEESFTVSSTCPKRQTEIPQQFKTHSATTTLAENDSESTIRNETLQENPFHKKKTLPKRSQSEIRSPCSIVATGSDASLSKSRDTIIHTDKTYVTGPSDAYYKLIRLAEKVVEKIFIMKSEGRTEITLLLKNIPHFEGAQLRITEFSSARGEFNLSFTNLTSQGHALISKNEARDMLNQALHEKGYVVHQITADIETIFAPESTASREDGQNQKDFQDSKEKSFDEDE
jgi:hypothetical protein